MSYYETIFEDGTHSVAQYETDAEALDAAGAHHDRATRGEKGGPGGNSAVRVVRILKYNVHPADFGVDKTLSKDVFNATVADLVKSHGDVVDLDALAAQIRDLSSPVEDSAPHDTNYRLKEDEELAISW